MHWLSFGVPSSLFPILLRKRCVIHCLPPSSCKYKQGIQMSSQGNMSVRIIFLKELIFLLFTHTWQNCCSGVFRWPGRPLIEMLRVWLKGKRCFVACSPVAPWEPVGLGLWGPGLGFFLMLLAAWLGVSLFFFWALVGFPALGNEVNGSEGASCTPGYRGLGGRG